MPLFPRRSSQITISSRRNVWFLFHFAQNDQSTSDSKEAMRRRLSQEIWILAFWATVASALNLKLPSRHSVNELRSPLERKTTAQQSSVLDTHVDTYSTLTGIQNKYKATTYSYESLPWFVTAHKGKNTRARETAFAAKKKATIPITNAHELRRVILDEHLQLKDVTVKIDVSSCKPEDLVNHEVIALIVRRFNEQSTPGHRSIDDKSILALSLEGGGMRGAVTAGMAAAIASLGLTDCFDRIYGSSAGSVVGAYMVSRQMCMDVYVDILPAAKRQFVCINRILSALAINALDCFSSYFPLKSEYIPKFAHRIVPGMNISFVLDGIMDHENGIRPLDLERFRENDKKQPLRIASSYAKEGKLRTKCFGTEDFSGQQNTAAKRVDGSRCGIYACLEASMTVPGATGPPVPILEGNHSIPFFDAFCFEPLPYRSAVEEGATHVLVLCSRPEGFQPKTAQGVYERAVAPLYFRSHGEPEAASFFEKGGQQYIYAEDLLVLDEGKRAGLKYGRKEPVLVPPAKVLYGVERDEETDYIANNRRNWNRAHLMPLKVPVGTPELPTLEQNRDAVLEAVRGGFAAAFDVLAPAIGLRFDRSLTGMEVAKAVFPKASRFGDSVLSEQVRVEGDKIKQFSTLPDIRFQRKSKNIFAEQYESILDELDHSTYILETLPGFSSGKMAHLAASLQRNQI